MKGKFEGTFSSSKGIRKMARKKRWVKKGAAKTKGWKRTGKKRGVKASKVTLLKFPSIQSCFPDELRTSLRVTTFSQIATTNAESSLSWKMNSFGLSAAPNLGVGPQANWAGNYLANYPTGLRYLLSPAVAAGSNAPYYAYVVNNTKIKYRVMPGDITTATPNSSIIRTMMIPQDAPSLAAMPVNTLAEQYRTKTYDIPNPVSGGTGAHTGGSLATSLQPWRTLVSNAAEVMGTPKRVMRYEKDYWGFANGEPAQVTYFHLVLNPDNPGANSFSADVEVQLTYDVTFFQRNPFSSVAPA